MTLALMDRSMEVGKVSLAGVCVSNVRCGRGVAFYRVSIVRAMHGRGDVSSAGHLRQNGRSMFGFGHSVTNPIMDIPT